MYRVRGKKKKTESKSIPVVKPTDYREPLFGLGRHRGSVGGWNTEMTLKGRGINNKTLRLEDMHIILANHVDVRSE